jgi:hypothetical protein
LTKKWCGKDLLFPKKTDLDERIPLFRSGRLPVCRDGGSGPTHSSKLAIIPISGHEHSEITYSLWFAKTLADFEINDIAALPATVLL